MHVLVTNDDGPPSNQSSPYVHPFVSALQSAGHLVSVILPHQQRSWISKAHFVHQLVRPLEYTPGNDPYSGGEGAITKPYQPISSDPDPAASGGDPEIDLNTGSISRQWVLVDGTPATCTQLGLYHVFKHRPAIDLIISGPNYGRNTTSLFSLSSGTIGGALEAATFGIKSIALSFAFWNRVHERDIISEACVHAVSVIEKLAGDKKFWKETDLWNVNVPLARGGVEETGAFARERGQGEGEEERKVMVCPILDNKWQSGSCFEEVDAPDKKDGEEEEAEKAAEREMAIREGKEKGGESRKEADEQGGVCFKWAPKFGDVQKSIENSEPGNDGWAVMQGFTSVTPLKANFMHASSVPYGEMKLPSPPSKPKIYAIIDADAYLLPLLHTALSTVFPPGAFTPISSTSDLPTPNTHLLQLTPYETIDFSHLLAHPQTSLANAYIIRKALIRKHHLSQSVSTWLVKHSNDTALRAHVPVTEVFELDYAEFLDDALIECWDLRESFARSEQAGDEGREWWLLKPGMSEQGQGVRLFSSEGGLRAVFEEWEGEQAGSEEDEGEEEMGAIAVEEGNKGMGAGTMTSQLRHFVVQRYVDNPLLFEDLGRRKFHIRSYVLAVGALKVYVYRDMLALFAPLPYAHPGDSSEGRTDPNVHLTNTCLQAGTPVEGSVHRFWDLPGRITPSSSSEGAWHPPRWQDNVFNQIKAGTAALFEAAAREQMVHFQTLPNAFEVFGMDWMVDEDGNAWLLEVNAFPDFKQSGEGLKALVASFWQEVIRIAVGGFFGMQSPLQAKEGDEMVQVLDVDLGRT